MESDDDYQQSTATTEPSSPINHKRLKRLKKAIRVPISQSPDLIPSTKITDPEFSETQLAENPVDLLPNELESEKLSIRIDLEDKSDENRLGNGVNPDAEMTDLVQSSGATGLLESEGLKKGRDLDSELDDLFVYRERSEVRPSFDVAEEEDQIEAVEKLNGEDGDGDSGEKLGEEKMEEKKSVKKKRSSKDRMDEERSKKSKKRVKSMDEKGKSEPPARTKRKLEKERKAHLEQLHAESQRLLRETRDAEFKPVPVVQKPISSILEKIRQRKLEVSKKASMLKNHFQTDDSSREIEIDLYPEQVIDGKFIDNNPAEVAVKEGDIHLANEESNDIEVTHIKCSNETTTRPIESETLLSNTALDEDSKTTFRAPIDDTQDLFDDTEQSDEEDMEDGQKDSSVDDEEVLAPSLLTMNLKLDSVPLDDDSSDEENYDKENVDPQPHKRTDELRGDPVKAFVDDEAEEEDDSDDDLMRFKEYEEDDDEDSEEFKDLIATGYEERPSDNIKRDQLHQKWLEQQDAAATDDVLQRLKCGSGKQKLKDLSALEVDDDNDDDEDIMDESGDELHANASRVRQNSRKMKQMIPQMYTDNNDVFLSDDEEETEQKLVRMRLLHKAEEQASLLSPAEDENSREVFGLIKKLNIAPEPKRKATTSCFFDSLITTGNSNSSSRSSFLGRAPTSSVPSANKAGSSNFRSFIFGRDDSNSRSAITSEGSSDMSENLNRATKTGTAKFISSSQSQTNSQTKNETRSSASLFEILRKSTQTDRIVRNNTVRESESQIAVQFAAFKSVKRVLKVDART